MIKFISLFLVMVSLVARAETPDFETNVLNSTVLNPDCPLTLAGIYQDRASSKRNRVSVHLSNQSDRRVIGVKVGFDGLDAVQDEHPFAKTFALALDLRPNRTGNPVWRVNDPDFEADTAGGIRVYLVKVVFGNGATWEDDGSRTCSLMISGRPKEPMRNNDDGE